MKILALETATTAGSIALLDDSAGIIGECGVNIRVAHSERLMSSIEWLLNASRVTIQDIDVFAVSSGPGSFTGLRIGVSTVKGFCFASGKPAVAVPTLDAFARVLPYSGFPVCPMLNARKNEIYTGLYQWKGTEMIRVIPNSAVRPEDFLRELTGPAVFIGEGALLYRNLISEVIGEKAFFGPPSRMAPSAATVAEIALEKFLAGETADPVQLTPNYIRKSEAEIKWKG